MGGNRLQPGTHRRKPAEIEAALVGYVRVSVEGDVDDRAARSPTKKSWWSFRRPHDPERGVSEFPLGLERHAALLGHWQTMGDPVPARGDVGFVRVLLEESLTQNLRPFEAVVDEERNALGQVEQDRV